LTKAVSALSSREAALQNSAHGVSQKAQILEISSGTRDASQLRAGRSFVQRQARRQTSRLDHSLRWPTRCEPLATGHFSAAP